MPLPEYGYWKRQLVVGLVALVICAVLALLRIIDIPHGLGIVAIAIALDTLVTMPRYGLPKPWPVAPIKFRGGERTEVARLAWATVSRGGTVAKPVLNHVRGIAKQQLAEKGVTWTGNPGDVPQPKHLAHQLLGAEAYNVLTTKKDIRPKALEKTVTRLEQLRNL
jgi:hypothetical protein